MKKYIKQKDDLSCGPVAIINAGRDFGINISSAHLEMLRGLCKTSPSTNGTLKKNFDQTLNTVLGWALNISYKNAPRLYDIHQAFANGERVILKYPTGPNSSHWTYMPMVNFAVNLGKDRPKTKVIDAQDLLRVLNGEPKRVHAWFIGSKLKHA